MKGKEEAAKLDQKHLQLEKIVVENFYAEWIKLLCAERCSGESFILIYLMDKFLCCVCMFLRETAQEEERSELTLNPHNQTKHILMLYFSIHCRSPQQFPSEACDTSWKLAGCTRWENLYTINLEVNKNLRKDEKKFLMKVQKKKINFKSSMLCYIKCLSRRYLARH